MDHISYRVRIDNYHAQFKRHDLPESYASANDAVDAIVKANYSAIDEDITVAADKLASFDDEHDKWEHEYSRLWEEQHADIREHGYEDGNGHRFYIEAVDDRTPFYVVQVRNFYGSREEWSFAHEDCFDSEAEFSTIAEAREFIKDRESERYVLASGEASRPDYYIVGERDKAWLDDDDSSKFDWDGCACKRRDADLVEICDVYSVLDDERYGTVAAVYRDDDVPTEGQFAKDCGYDPDDIDNPNDYVPTVTLHDYVISIGDGYKNNLVGLPDDVAQKIDDWFDRREDCCGECDNCTNWMRAQEIAYIREHAINEED